MKKEYEKCIEKVDNEKMKEALIQAFDKHRCTRGTNKIK